MSICVVVKVGEGVVLATDSAVSVLGGPLGPEGPVGPPGVIKVFLAGRKLLQIGELPVGVVTWGSGSLRNRTIASFVEEFENAEKIRKLTPANLEIDKIADDLWKFLLKKSDTYFAQVPRQSRPKTGVVVCGYSKQEFFPEGYGMVVPVDKPYRIRPDRDGNPNFGASWYGMTDAIIRFHYGRDPKIFAILKSHGIEDNAIQKIKEEIDRSVQYRVLFEAMPLGDAIEYARFLVELTIERFRFVAGAEICGGKITLATITRKGGFEQLSLSRTKTKKEGF